ncbi:hypothetical protein [Pseudoalteromonas ruthenica]|uniref:hypothetical protein n=1 Tax=Pseudoalteromonas ruthenica TaxID=151081 RepID=UPI00110BB90D|nr:hypothetical protein [Pseudoalteromonas ruthenica]TMP23752.1 hypothetical protein CWC06_09365 [Pseudoalteromonas ruthenica]
MTSENNSLTNLDTSELLEAFISAYNADLERTEMKQDELLIAYSRIDAREREIESLKATLTQHVDDLNKATEALDGAEKLATHVKAKTSENDRLKRQVSDLQQQIRKLNQLGDPKRLKDQIKRQKEQTEKYQLRCKKLETEAKEYRKEIDSLRSERNTATAKVAELKKQLAHDTGSGVYHNGSHHLIIWPQKTKMERPDGTRFEGRSLLYLHQCGRGGLISYDPDNGAKLCAAPKGGLRPSNETLEFAQNWLFKVNESQDGIVYEEDMQPVNYNPDLS